MVVMVLVCGCSYGAGKALALMPLIALPVVFFFALVMKKQAVILFSCSNALSRVPMTWYRSAGNSKGSAHIRAPCV